MSHFTVLVIGPDPERQLAPFHEFECTGNDNQFVKDVDQTEQIKAEYVAATTTRLIDQDGKLHYPCADRFYRDPTAEEAPKVGAGCGWNGELSYFSKDWGDGRGYRAKVAYIPEGMREVTVPRSQIETFAEYVVEYHGKELVGPDEQPDTNDEHKYGYALTDRDGNIIKVVDRTNPDHQWDWYQLGGRWTGMLKLKTGRLGALGKPGFMDNEADAGFVDQARIGDIDFAGMRDRAGQEAAVRYDHVLKLFDGLIPRIEKNWSQFLEDAAYGDDYARRRADYHGQPALIALKAIQDRVCADQTVDKDYRSFVTWLELKDYQVDRSEYIDQARNQAFSTFAVIKDGVWYERGRMGWWGAVLNEKDEAVWSGQFRDLVASLSDDTLISIYDCHT